MAKLFIKQAKEYAKGRPTYPTELYEFIASKTPSHHLVWDVGTGSGQAIPPLAKIYERVIATDSSEKQLEHAPRISNVKYKHTCSNMSTDRFQQVVASESTLDLVTIAQALHWFPNPEFFKLVKWALKKPNGVIAAWCYTTSEVNVDVDAVFGPFYSLDCKPYWEKPHEFVDNKYADIHFPFEPVDGLDHTGPFEFKAEKLMTFQDFLVYLRSWSAYNTAKDKGVELLTDDLIHKFNNAWNTAPTLNGNGTTTEQKLVIFPIYLRIGKVGH